MVSGGTVRSDLSSVVSAMGNYGTSFQSLSGSWEGESYTSLAKQVEEFSGEYKSTIEGQMNAFAAACDLYVEYIDTKRKLESVQEAYNLTPTSEKTQKSAYEQEIASYQSKLNELKKDIETSLQGAASGSLSASGGNTAAPTGTGTTGVTSTQGALSDAQIQQLLEFAKSQIGQPYNSMHYGPKEGDDGGFGCAMFVSYAYNNLLFGGASAQEKGLGGFYGSCKNYWGNATNDGFNAYNKGFVEVSASEARPGDIICFVDTNGKGTGHNDAESCYHVGLYEGDGKMIHSSTTTNGVGEIDIDKYIKKRGRGGEYYFLRYVGTGDQASQV